MINEDQPDRINRRPSAPAKAGNQSWQSIGHPPIPAFFGIGQHFSAMADANAAAVQEGGLAASKLVLDTGLTAGQFAAQSISHGIAGGTIAEMQGGKFGHGFLSAGLSKAATPKVMSLSRNTFAQGAMLAIVGGGISRVSGGKFANGAVTAAMAFAFNQCASGGCSRQQRGQDRANELAQEITDRGFFESKGEADWLYQINSDPDLVVTVDASKLTVSAHGEWEVDPNGGYRASGYVENAYSVHGQVTIRHRLDDTYGIYDETYNFELHRDFSPRGIARNIGTVVGRPPGGWPNTPYEIAFRGNTNITNPRVPISP